MKSFWRWWPTLLIETNAVVRYGFWAYTTALMARKSQSRFARWRHMCAAKKLQELNVAELQLSSEDQGAE